jgi:hypothetical protein
MKDLGVLRKVRYSRKNTSKYLRLPLLKRTHSSWDPVAKEYTMAYDKQLKDFPTMYDEEAIL